MNALLDSHTILWFVFDDPKLSSSANSLLESAETRKYISLVSIWEIGIKVKIGKLSLGGASLETFVRELEDQGFVLLPITLPHLLKAVDLPLHHRDPFDRLIIAQAIHENMTLLSNEELFDNYGVRRVW